MQVDEELLALAQSLGGCLLGVDTSSALASVCFIDLAHRQIRTIELPAASVPSEFVAQSISQELERAGCSAHELKAIVVGLGPGSFTGLRVGLATVKGLAIGANVPLVGVSSMAMRAATAGRGLTAIALDARREQIFAALYDVDENSRVTALVPDHVTSRADFEVQVQSLASSAVRWLDDTICTPRAAYGVLIAAERLHAGEYDDVAALLPHYLRVSEAERQLQARR